MRGETRKTTDTATRRPFPAARGGFSLIEILVATTILIIIVLVVSMLFQQASGAFQDGLHRTKNQTVLRAIVGIVSRDLVLAVDGRDYPGIGELKGDAIAVDGNSIAFVALTGRPGKDDRRTPQLIEFKTGGFGGGEITRRETDIDCVNNKWTKKTSRHSVINPGKPINIGSAFFKPVWDEDDRHALPLRIDIEATLPLEGRSALVSGLSHGRNGVLDDVGSPRADDIIVGGL
jgi:type II secretory pathway component PulJ